MTTRDTYGTTVTHSPIPGCVVPTGSHFLDGTPHLSHPAICTIANRRYGQPDIVAVVEVVGDVRTMLELRGEVPTI